MDTQAPTKPPLREQFTVLGIEQLVKTFLDLQHNVFEAAGRFGLTLAELEEALSWPEARELLERAQRLSALRTQPALELIFPCAIDRLASVMFDEQAPAEARRKSAALLARICESRRRERRLNAAPRRPPSPAPTTPPPRATITPPTPAPPEPHTEANITERDLVASFPLTANTNPNPEPPNDAAEVHEDSEDHANNNDDDNNDDYDDNDFSHSPTHAALDLSPLYTFPATAPPPRQQPDTS